MADSFAPFDYQIVTMGIKFTPENLHINDTAPPKRAESLTDKNVLNDFSLNEECRWWAAFG